jgi:hypothetical protein
MHAWDEPPETLTRLAPAAGVPLLMPRLGEPAELSRDPMVDPWWREVAAHGAPVPAMPITAGQDAPLDFLPD